MTKKANFSPDKTIGPAKSPRGAKTRMRIREAANRLFIEGDFRGTTVDAIVETAGVSKGTFYLHFDRKEDLLLEYGSVRLQHIRSTLPDLLVDKTFEQALNEILDQVVRGKQWDRELTGLAISEMRVNADRLPIENPHKLLQPLVELAQARDEVRADIPPEALAMFVLRSLLGALRDGVLGFGDLTREEALDYAMVLIMDATRQRIEPGRNR